MNGIFHLAITAVAFVLMTLVGTDCTAGGLQSSLRRPWLAGTVSIGQFIIVPALMYLCCLLIGVPAEVMTGLMLISCCPAGAMSNTYCYLINSNTTLSVSLTVIASLAALIATPFALHGVGKVISAQHIEIPPIPLIPMIRELGIMIILPVAVGAGIRARLPGWVLENQHLFRKLAFASTAALILLIIGSSPEAVFKQIRDITLITCFFTIALGATGWVMSLAFKLSATDRWVLLFEFPCRNLAIAAVIGITVLDKPELVRFGATLFLIQTALFLVLVWAVNRRRK